MRLDRVSGRLPAILLPAVVLGLGGCRPPAVAPIRPPAATSSGSEVRFVDATRDAGITFRHTHGGTGKRLMVESVGSGCAWFDYDSDGWPDLLLVNCAPLSDKVSGVRPTMALYHNRKDGTFEDRTAGSGLDVMLYGQGATSVDYDGDGRPDLFLTCLGGNHLFRNLGGGRFKDVTAGSGLADGEQRWRWHTGAAWLDYDRDGKLDVFVARYVKWTPETDQFCGIPGGLKRYCPPAKYAGETCALFRNLGNGRFQDVSRATGVSQVVGKWFQPLVVDANHDGWPDVMVTSDGTPTALFRNEKGRRFTDIAAEAGVSVSETGIPKSGMGIDAADWRNQGRESTLIGNFSGDRLSLFEPDATNLYTNVAGPIGMGESSLYSLTFGLAFLDADLDGWQDAFIGNGHIDDYIEKFEAHVTYREPPLFYHNLRGERFEELGMRAGPAMGEKLVVRGCAVADFDRDGDPDVVVVESNGPARLFRNDTPHHGHWLRVELRGKKGNLEAVGARVEVTAGGLHQTRWMRAGAMFLSQSELPLAFGLGTASQCDVLVTWPDGTRTEQKGVPPDKGLTLKQGE